MSQQLEAAAHTQLIVSAGTRQEVEGTDWQGAGRPGLGPTAWLKTSARTDATPRKLKGHLAAGVHLLTPLAPASSPVSHQ